jgi:hypothetical protein
MVCSPVPGEDHWNESDNSGYKSNGDYCCIPLVNIVSFNKCNYVCWGIYLHSTDPVGTQRIRNDAFRASQKIVYMLSVWSLDYLASGQCGCYKQLRIHQDCEVCFLSQTRHIQGLCWTSSSSMPSNISKIVERISNTTRALSLAMMCVRHSTNPLSIYSSAGPWNSRRLVAANP